MILAIDQGTTGTTCLLFDREGRIAGRAYSEFEQHFPRPGWVEHDAAEIWEVTRRVAAEAIAAAGIDGAQLDGIGIANQRETVVAWDPASGEPLHRALVWQDRRTAERCEELRAAGHEQLVRERTGPRPRPLLLGHQDRVAGAQRRGRGAGGVRHDRLLARLQADRPPRNRLHQRLADDALRHPPAALGRGALRAARGRPGAAAGAAALRLRLRDDRRVRRRGPGGGDRRRPAGRALRPGLLRAGQRQEHLRDGQLRPPQHRRAGARARRRPAHHARLRDRRAWPTTRSRPRSSSPAPRCSGCATASA